MFYKIFVTLAIVIQKVEMMIVARSILFLFLFLGCLNANDITYICTIDKVEIINQNGKVVTEERILIGHNRFKLVLKKEWYGKPSALSFYRYSGNKYYLKSILPNTQTKVEWIKSNELKFENNEGVFILSKDKSPKVTMTSKSNSKDIQKGHANCIEQ